MSRTAFISTTTEGVDLLNYANSQAGQDTEKGGAVIAANLGAPTYYQWWYRDPTNPCSGQGFNFTNGWCVTWLP